MSHNRLRVVSPATLYDENVTLISSNLFSKSRQGIVFRPTNFAPTIYAYILPYDISTTAPEAADVLDHAKYIVKYGQEALDLSYGKNISFAIACQPGESTEVLIEEYL